MRMYETLLVVRVRGREQKLSAWFRDSGQDLIVLLHGLGNSKDTWRRAWETPLLRDRSLLSFDLPGFGHTPPTAGAGYSLEDHAGLLSAVVDAYAVRNIHIAAHSMGGSIALLLPDRIAQRLAGLYLVEPRLCRSSCGIAAEAADVGFEQFTAETLPRYRKRYASDPGISLDLDRADAAAMYSGASSLIKWADSGELVRRFNALQIHKRLIYGQRNHHLEELGMVDPAHQLEIPDAGHFAMNDNPAAFYSGFAELLPEVAGAGA